MGWVRRRLANRLRLDGHMKEITEAALEHVLLAHPKAEVIERDGNKVVRIPMYDVENDRSWFEERKIKPDPERKGKFAPGDVLGHTKTGALFNIVDPIRAMLKVRRGPKSEE